MLYFLEPEVAGELGENTVFENVRLEGEKSKIKKLHYKFNGWLGDLLLECTPCFIISDSLLEDFNRYNLSGYELQDIEISISDEFKELYPDVQLPNFKRIIPYGRVKIINDSYKEWSGHDFCLSDKSCLVVTDKVLNILKSNKINHCDIYSLSKLNKHQI